jgi:hypothetical protein
VEKIINKINEKNNPDKSKNLERNPHDHVDKA